MPKLFIWVWQSFLGTWDGFWSPFAMMQHPTHVQRGFVQPAFLLLRSPRQTPSGKGLIERSSWYLMEPRSVLKAVTQLCQLTGPAMWKLLALSSEFNILLLPFRSNWNSVEPWQRKYVRNQVILLLSSINRTWQLCELQVLVARNSSSVKPYVFGRTCSCSLFCAQNFQDPCGSQQLLLADA